MSVLIANAYIKTDLSVEDIEDFYVQKTEAPCLKVQKPYDIKIVSKTDKQKDFSKIVSKGGNDNIENCSELVIIDKSVYVSDLSSGLTHSDVMLYIEDDKIYGDFQNEKGGYYLITNLDEFNSFVSRDIVSVVGINNMTDDKGTKISELLKETFEKNEIVIFKAKPNSNDVIKLMKEITLS